MNSFPLHLRRDGDELETLKPRIGWFVRKSNQEYDHIRALKSTLRGEGELRLNVNEINIPILKKGKIPSLVIQVFDENVRIPKEVNELNIQRLIIHGSFSSEYETKLQKDFPDAEIDNWNT